jgi:periplasmic protein TonB
VNASDFSPRFGALRWGASLVVVLALHMLIALFILFRAIRIQPSPPPPQSVLVDLAPQPPVAGKTPGANLPPLATSPAAREPPARATKAPVLPAPTTPPPITPAPAAAPKTPAAPPPSPQQKVVTPKAPPAPPAPPSAPQATLPVPAPSRTPAQPAVEWPMPEPPAEPKIEATAPPNLPSVQRPPMLRPPVPPAPARPQAQSRPAPTKSLAVPKAAVVPQPISPAQIEDRIRAWQERMIERLYQNHYFSGDPSLRDRELAAVVRFALDDQGRLLSLEIVRSSGYASLDREAINMFRRSALPPPPPELVGKSFEITVTLTQY